jgi:V8-like Glu-specific endopeptidase
VQLAPTQKIPESLVTPEGQATPEEYGTSNLVYTTSRASALGDLTVDYYPFRAAGRLFFEIGAAAYVCSASLIKPGVVVTAAHCVIKFGSGKSGFYHDWVFVPAYNNGLAPYGSWTVSYATVLTAYQNGTDSCEQAGVVCEDDVAVLVLHARSGKYAGTAAGWFGYGWNGYSYNGSGQVNITQLGFPVDLDGGFLMERNDAQGRIVASMSNNTVMASLMTGGSSGGPWLVNFGMAPTLAGTSFGSGANHNVVVGVTSWGNTNTAVKEMGAAPFTSKNIVALVNAVCGKTPAAC